MARKKKRDYDDDDGRTIVPMNVDGMPWYTGGFTPPEDRDADPNAPVPERRPMSKDEARGYAWAAAKAGLLIGAVFVVVYALFLLFCRYIWLR